MTPRPRIERLLLVLTPAVAMAAVAMGLRLGAREGLRAAIVRAAPASSAGTGFAWQIVVFDEDQGAREPAGGVGLAVLAHAGDASATWTGRTNGDGVAEARLALPPAADVSLDVREVGETAGARSLARGVVGVAERPAADPRATLRAGWLRFARREGPIDLDVALLGERAAPGFPADLQVRATEAASHAPVAGALVTIESDTSLRLTPAATGTTDSRGWAHLTATPVGLAVTATLRARAADGRTGAWIGGLFMSPGAPGVDLAARVEPGAPVRLGVTMPTARSAAYVEIDDAHGRAWAAAVATSAQPDGTSRADVESCGLAPGLYWAVASADPASDAGLGAGTLARPFFVASSDAAALAFGTEPAVCAPPRDPRETAAALGPCLALATVAPVARWTALDGFVAERGLDREARARGLAVAIGALAVAIALEALLLLRAASHGVAGLGEGADPAGAGATPDTDEGDPLPVTDTGKALRGLASGRARTVALAVLVGLLGFALLAAFIVRV